MRLSECSKKRESESSAATLLGKRRRLTEADRLVISAGIGSDWHNRPPKLDEAGKVSSRLAKIVSATISKTKEGGERDKGPAASYSKGGLRVGNKKSSISKKPEGVLKERQDALKVIRKGRETGKFLLERKSLPAASEEEEEGEEEDETVDQQQHAERDKEGALIKGALARTYLDEIAYDGETFKVGDSAYVVMDPDTFDWEAAEEEVCQVCGSAECDTLLECDKCLLGFHLSCLRPPLKDVPKVLQP